MELELKLSVDEINSLLQVLGELPTKAGVYPLAMKIKLQADAQVSQPQTEEDS